MGTQSGLVHRNCDTELELTFPAPEHHPILPPEWYEDPSLCIVHGVGIWLFHGVPDTVYLEGEGPAELPLHLLARFPQEPDCGAWTIVADNSLAYHLVVCSDPSQMPIDVYVDVIRQHTSVTLNVTKDGNREWQCESQTGSCACAQGTEDCCQAYGAATG